eukprot:5212808-Amphidinium_carterae.1
MVNICSPSPALSSSAKRSSPLLPSKELLLPATSWQHGQRTVKATNQADDMLSHLQLKKHSDYGLSVRMPVECAGHHDTAELPIFAQLT